MIDTTWERLSIVERTPRLFWSAPWIRVLQPNVPIPGRSWAVYWSMRQCVSTMVERSQSSSVGMLGRRGTRQVGGTRSVRQLCVYLAHRRTCRCLAGWWRRLCHKSHWRFPWLMRPSLPRKMIINSADFRQNQPQYLSYSTSPWCVSLQFGYEKHKKLFFCLNITISLVTKVTHRWWLTGEDSTIARCN